MKTTLYAVTSGDFHADRILSRHRSLRTAYAALSRHDRQHRSECSCGGGRIVRLHPGRVDRHPVLGGGSYTDLTGPLTRDEAETLESLAAEAAR